MPDREVVTAIRWEVKRLLGPYAWATFGGSLMLVGNGTSTCELIFDDIGWYLPIDEISRRYLMPAARNLISRELS
jgi:hypothetical protein